MRFAGADPRLVRLFVLVAGPSVIYMHSHWYAPLDPWPDWFVWALWATWAVVLFMSIRGWLLAAIRRPAFGCPYCADGGNRSHGRLEQLASNAIGQLLLRCPRCHSLYSVAADGTYRTTGMTADEARGAFPEWRPARDIPQP